MSSIDIQETISQFIESQFPRHYREQEGVELTESQRSVLVDFVEAYYEWIESQIDEGPLRSRKMFEYKDVDTTPQAFIEYFRKKYLADLTYTAATDERFLIKNIIDLYRAKGSESSIKLLIRLLFNEDASVYFPGQDVLRASDSRWVDPIYVEVASSVRSTDYLNRRVYGSISGASAFVEGIVTKRVSNRLIDIIYLSDVEGTFLFGDIISDDGILADAPQVIGSLSGVTVPVNNEGGNAIGDILDVNSLYGINGQVRVTSVADVTGAVEFSINDGGYGYTIGDTTQVYVSDIVVLRDNSNTVFDEDDIITQKLETIYLNVGIDTNQFIESIDVGDVVEGLDSDSAVTSNGTIMQIGTETINNLITPFIRVQTDNGTFIRNQTITLTTDAEFVVGRNLFEGDDLTLEIENANGVFSNGEVVYQREFVANTGNTVSTRYAFGEVVSSNSSYLTITNAFGNFEEFSTVTGYTSGAFADVANVEVDFSGATGLILEKTANNQYVVVTTDQDFTGNNKVRGEASKVIATVANLEVSSAATVRVDSEDAVINAVANTYYSGIVIGQNTVSIGIAKTDEYDFNFIANTSVFVNQDGTELLLESIATGRGADFDIGSLENTEEIVASIERIVDTNIAEVRYEDILITGEGSGVGFVNSVDVIDGGNGYSNSSTVSFLGGGYSNQQPVIAATGNVVTDANGSIVSITMNEFGEGYFSAPTIQVANGASSNLQVNMTFGYGFPEDPLANPNTIIGDVLTNANLTIGTIATLTNIQRGTGYTGRPYVKVVNPSVAVYNKLDQIADISLTRASFAVGEIITQANTAARGIVLAANTTQLTLRNLSFDEDFIVTSSGGKITGALSTAEANINTINYDDTSEYMGDNAIINNFVVESAGTIDAVAVISSGLGYIPGETVTLTNTNTTISGVALIESQGRDPGYWKSTTSHISSEKKLHDNNYYQEFSYDIRSPKNFGDYRDIILDVLHLAGTRLFGTVVKTTEEQLSPSSESTITQS